MISKENNTRDTKSSIFYHAYYTISQYIIIICPPRHLHVYGYCQPMSLMRVHLIPSSEDSDTHTSSLDIYTVWYLILNHIILYNY